MAGLMLADKTSGIQDRMSELTEKLAAQEQLINELRNTSREVSGPSDALTALVARAETLADQVEGALT